MFCKYFLYGNGISVRIHLNSFRLCFCSIIHNDWTRSQRTNYNFMHPRFFFLILDNICFFFVEKHNEKWDEDEHFFFKWIFTNDRFLWIILRLVFNSFVIIVCFFVAILFYVCLTKHSEVSQCCFHMFHSIRSIECQRCLPITFIIICSIREAAGSLLPFSAFDSCSLSSDGTPKDDKNLNAMHNEKTTTTRETRNKWRNW